MKAPHTVLDVWKACWIPKLSQGFLEPFTPCEFLVISTREEKKFLIISTVKYFLMLIYIIYLPAGISQEVAFLLHKKTKEPVRNAEAPEKLELPGSPTVGRSSEQTAFAPETPVQLTATKAPDKSPEKLDLPGSPVVDRFPEQAAGCSKTPIQCSTSMGLVEGIEITLSDRAMPASSFETVDKEPFSTANQEFDIDLMNEVNISLKGTLQRRHST